MVRQRSECPDGDRSAQWVKDKGSPESRVVAIGLCFYFNGKLNCLIVLINSSKREMV